MKKIDESHIEYRVIAVNCRECNNDGVIPVQISDDDWEPQQCEFCYTVPYSVFNINRAIYEYENITYSKIIKAEEPPF